MYAQGRKQELQRVLRTAATAASVPAFITLIVFLSFGGPLLGLVFDDYYRGGATVLSLLALGGAVNVWVGASGMALVMTGHQTVAMVIAVSSGLLTVVSGLLVVGPYGATGVAAAAASGVAICNIALWLVTRHKTGIWTHASFKGLTDIAKAANVRAAE
jgi:O-antigen/teichoic acid export membrane protein